jgi:hypothetical protein
MTALQSLCGSGTCIWVYNNGTWTIQSDNCDASSGCGCFDSTSTPTFLIDAKTGKQVMDSKGKPVRYVSQTDFLDKARTMLKDTRLTGRTTKDGKTLLLNQSEPSSPIDNVSTFETPCMS